MTTGGKRSASRALDGKVLDLKTFDALREFLGERADAAIVRLGDAFLEHTPARLKDIRHALDLKDAGAVARAAHVIKGGSAQLGAVRLQTLAATLEALAKTDDLEGVQRELHNAEMEYQKAADELKSLIAESS